MLIKVRLCVLKKERFEEKGLTPPPHVRKKLLISSGLST
jgi:hypothetical protein